MEKFLKYASIILFAGSILLFPFMNLVFVMGGLMNGELAYLLLVVSSGASVFHQKKRKLWLLTSLILILFATYVIWQSDQALKLDNAQACQEIMTDPYCTLSQDGSFECSEESDNGIGGIIPNCPLKN